MKIISNSVGRLQFILASGTCIVFGVHPSLWFLGKSSPLLAKALYLTNGFDGWGFGPFILVCWRSGPRATDPITLDELMVKLRAEETV